MNEDLLACASFYGIRPDILQKFTLANPSLFKGTYTPEEWLRENCDIHNLKLIKLYMKARSEMLE